MNITNASQQLRSQQVTDSYSETLKGATAQPTIGVTTTQPPTSSDPTPSQDGKPSAVVALSAGAQLFTRALQAATNTPVSRADRLAQAQAKMEQDLTPEDMSRLAAKLLNP